MKLAQKKQLLQKRRWRIRKKIQGSKDIPRLSVRFTNKHIYAQLIDDEQGVTLASASTNSKGVKDQGLRPNIEGAKKLGAILAEGGKAAKVEKIVFDRNGRRYHGCIKAFADAVREGGLKF